MAALPIELIDLIAQKCEQHTLLNVCIASKDVHENSKKRLSEIETHYICDTMQKMISECYNTSNMSSRLKCMHRTMRKILQYDHFLKRNKKLVIVITGKLDEWSSFGMSIRKCKRYKKKLESLIEI